jgi:hypothetical protein
MPPNFAPIVILPLATIGCAIAAAMAWRSGVLHRRELLAVITNYRQQLTALGLSDSNARFINSSFFPALEHSIRQSQRYRSAFSLGAVLNIWLSFLATSIVVLTSGILSGWAVWGLAIIGLLSAGQTGWILLNSFTQPGQRYRDSTALRYQLEECINELLSLTPEIPLEDQFIQFCDEFKQIRSMAHAADIKWIDNAQRASKSIIDETSEQLRQSRTEYRSKYSGNSNDLDPQPDGFIANPSIVGDRRSTVVGSSVGNGISRVQQTGLVEMELEPEVDAAYATIGDTGMTPAQYIALSTADDEDTAIFLNQGADD